MEQPEPQRLRLTWIVALMVIAIAYRVFSAGNSDLVNTAPLMAMAFGGGLLLGKKFWWVPSLLLICSDIALGMAAGIGLGSYTLMSGVCYTLAALAGSRLGINQITRPGNWPVMWLGTMICSVAFYLFANTFSWALSPLYAKTVAGWWQSQTLGIPGFPPSLLFLRNALIGDTLWCVVAAPLFFWNAMSLRRREALSD